jgi:hypothetical protein
MTNDQIPMTKGMPAALVIGAWALVIRIGRQRQIQDANIR